MRHSSLEKMRILNSFEEGERVKVSGFRTVDRKPLDTTLTYIFVGHNHDYDALILMEDDEDTLENHLKIHPAGLNIQ